MGLRYEALAEKITYPQALIATRTPAVDKGIILHAHKTTLIKVINAVDILGLPWAYRAYPYFIWGGCREMVRSEMHGH